MRSKYERSFFLVLLMVILSLSDRAENEQELNMKFNAQTLLPSSNESGEVVRDKELPHISISRTASQESTLQAQSPAPFACKISSLSKKVYVSSHATVNLLQECSFGCSCPLYSSSRTARADSEPALPHHRGNINFLFPLNRSEQSKNNRHHGEQKKKSRSKSSSSPQRSRSRDSDKKNSNKNGRRRRKKEAAPSTEKTIRTQ